MSVHEIVNEVLEIPCLLEEERSLHRIALGVAMYSTADANPVADPEKVFERILDVARLDSSARSYYRHRFRRALGADMEELAREMVA